MEQHWFLPTKTARDISQSLQDYWAKATVPLNADIRRLGTMNWQFALSASCNRKQTNLWESVFWSAHSCSWQRTLRPHFTSSCTPHELQKSAPLFLYLQLWNSLCHEAVEQTEGLVQPQGSRHRLLNSLYWNKPVMPLRDSDPAISDPSVPRNV